MPENSNLNSFPIQVKGFVLTECSFSRAEQLPEGERQLQGEVGIDAQEPEGGQIRVDLSVSMEDEGVFRAFVSYAVVLEKIEEFSEYEGFDQDASEEEIWEEVIKQVVPVVAYPYARELMTSLFNKAELPAFIPPIVDWSTAVISMPEEVDEEKPA